MTNYDDILEYENESYRLDFKCVQYQKDQHSDLLKDIIAFANANTDDDRFIIIGITFNEKKEKDFRGIKKEEFIDPAIYQQLVRKNIEPDINFEYFLYSYQGKYFPIFRMFDCTNKPYLMKKDYGPLRQGDSWIRKGTHQPRLTRRDLDEISEGAKATRGFSGEVRCVFSESGADIIELPSSGEIKLPSEIEAEIIHKIIMEKQNPTEPPRQTVKTISDVVGIFHSPSRKYITKSIEELETALKNVKKEHQNDDLYYLFESCGERVNISIFNLGDGYIEDALVKVIFPKIEGLTIADKIYEPPDRPTLFKLPSYSLIGYGVGYPRVEYLDDEIEVSTHLEKIRHHLPINEVFSQDIRIFIHKSVSGRTIPLKCIIYGKNLLKPIIKELKICIKSAS